MIKIILSDIDGTFLRDSKSPPDLHIAAIKSVITRGLKFVFVSARMPEAIYPITDALNMPHTPVISYGGGLALTEREEIIFDKKISADDTRNVLAELKHWTDITPNYYTGRRWFAEEIDSRVQVEMNITSATAEVASFDGLLRENILPNKILIMCEPPTCAEMERVLGEKFPALNVVRSSTFLLEIMDKTVSKATGINALLNHYGLTIDEAVAFGDNYNDAEMLRLIPQSVAMGNAPDAVKKMAAAVTDTNEAGGIYTYLAKIGVIAP